MLAVYLRYRQLYEYGLMRPASAISKRANRTAFILGLASSFGLCMVANFQVKSLPLPHFIGAFMCFVLGTVYFTLQVSLAPFNNLSFVQNTRRFSLCLPWKSRIFQRPCLPQKLRIFAYRAVRLPLSEFHKDQCRKMALLSIRYCYDYAAARLLRLGDSTFSRNNKAVIETLKIEFIPPREAMDLPVRQTARKCP